MLLILVFIVRCPLCAVQTHAEKIFTGVGKLKFLEGAKESRGGQVFGGTVKALSCFVGKPKKPGGTLLSFWEDPAATRSLPAYCNPGRLLVVVDVCRDRQGAYMVGWAR